MKASILAVMLSLTLVQPANAGPFDRPCSVSPNPVTVGGAYTITDTGLKEQTSAGTEFLIWEYWPSGLEQTYIWSDGKGNVSLTETATEPADVYVELYNLGYYGRRHGYREAGDCAFTSTA
jgi:hypothetical protein